MNDAKNASLKNRELCNTYISNIANMQALSYIHKLDILYIAAELVTLLYWSLYLHISIRWSGGQSHWSHSQAYQKKQITVSS